MATQFARIVAELKRQERKLAVQLTKVREAISLLEFGGGGVPAPAIIETPKAVRVRGKVRRVRKGRKAEAPARKRR
jgi:hypothetical protein